MSLLPYMHLSKPLTCSACIRAPLQPAKTPGTLRRPAALALGSASSAKRATKPPATPRYLHSRLLWKISQTRMCLLRVKPSHSGYGATGAAQGEKDRLAKWSKQLMHSCPPGFTSGSSNE